MSFTLKIGLNQSWAAFQKVETIDALKPMMYFALKACVNDRQSFSVFCLDDARAQSGWGLEKSEDGYCFWLACNAPFNGFTVRPGLWAYRVGKSWEPCRWYGGGDFAWRPKQMFLPCDVAEKLVLQLYRNEPFHYDPEHWVNTDDCALEPPTEQ